MAENGKGRNRSPEHPVFDLKTAIERAKVLRDKEHHGFTNKATAMGHWGYGPKSSAGVRTLAALLHFGLLEERGTGKSRQVCLSTNGRILTNLNSPAAERRAALREAALSPGIYQKLGGEWHNLERLPSDSTMAYELEENWGFNPKSIGGFIEDLKATLEFANLLQDGSLSGEAGGTPEKPDGNGESDNQEVVPPPSQPQAEGSVPEHTAGAKMEQYRIPLPRGGTAVLSLPVPMSGAAFDMISAWLTLTRPAITEEAGQDSQAASSDDDGA